jgi:hypothetical protein
VSDRRKYSRAVGRQVIEANLGVQGQDKLTDVMNAIMPVHESRAIRDWELFYENIVPFSYTEFQAAVAAERSMHALALDASAPAVAFLVIVQMTCRPSAGAAGIFKMTTQAEAAATLSVSGTRVVCRDTRVQSPNPSYRGDLIIPYIGSDPTFVGDNSIEVGSTAGRTTFDQFCIIRPGFAAIIENDTVNIGLGGSFHGLAFGLL